MSPEGHRADRSQHGHWSSGRPEAPGLRLPAPRPCTQPLGGLLRMGLCPSPPTVRPSSSCVHWRDTGHYRPGRVREGLFPGRGLAPATCLAPRAGGQGAFEPPMSRSPTARHLSRAPAQPLQHWHGEKVPKVGTMGGEWSPAGLVGHSPLHTPGLPVKSAQWRSDPSAAGREQACLRSGRGVRGARGDALASGDAAVAQAPCSGTGSPHHRACEASPHSPPPHRPRRSPAWARTLPLALAGPDLV